MNFNIQCTVVAALVLALGSGQLVTARNLLQDAPIGEIQCDVAIVGGGPGECCLLVQSAGCL